MLFRSHPIADNIHVSSATCRRPQRSWKEQYRFSFSRERAHDGHAHSIIIVSRTARRRRIADYDDDVNCIAASTPTPIEAAEEQIPCHAEDFR